MTDVKKLQDFCDVCGRFLSEAVSGAENSDGRFWLIYERGNLSQDRDHVFYDACKSCARALPKLRRDVRRFVDERNASRDH